MMYVASTLARARDEPAETPLAPATSTLTTMLFDVDKNNKPIEWNRIIIERYLHNYLRARYEFHRRLSNSM